MEIFLPIKVVGQSLELNILAVWNFYSVAKQGPFQGKVEDDAVELAALAHYKHFLQAEYSLVAGDWNIAPTFGGKKIEAEFYRINSLLTDLKLKSLYHHHTNEEIGLESTKTYKSVRGQKQHMLDYIHANESLLKKMKNFRITPVEEVVNSDHAVLCVDFDLD